MDDRKGEFVELKSRMRRNQHGSQVSGVTKVIILCIIRRHVLTESWVGKNRHLKEGWLSKEQKSCPV